MHFLQHLVLYLDVGFVYMIRPARIRRPYPYPHPISRAQGCYEALSGPSTTIPCILRNSASFCSPIESVSFKPALGDAVRLQPPHAAVAVPNERPARWREHLTLHRLRIPIDVAKSSSIDAVPIVHLFKAGAAKYARLVPRVRRPVLAFGPDVGTEMVSLESDIRARTRSACSPGASPPHPWSCPSTSHVTLTTLASSSPSPFV